MTIALSPAPKGSVTDLAIDQVSNFTHPTTVNATGVNIAYGNPILTSYRHGNVIEIQKKGTRPIYTLRHEFGHWLGLGHQLVNKSIMSYMYGGNIFSPLDLGRLVNAYQ